MKITGFDQIRAGPYNQSRIYEAKPPLVIISKTSKGRGTTITENQRLWHYRVPEGSDLETMKKELEMGLEAFDEYKKTASVPSNLSPFVEGH